MADLRISAPPNNRFGGFAADGGGRVGLSVNLHMSRPGPSCRCRRPVDVRERRTGVLHDPVVRALRLDPARAVPAAVRELRAARRPRLCLALSRRSGGSREAAAWPLEEARSPARRHALGVGRLIGSASKRGRLHLTTNLLGRSVLPPSLATMVTLSVYGPGGSAGSAKLKPGLSTPS